MTRKIPATRCRRLNQASLRPEGLYVLYWMIASRRTRHNFALQHAIAEGHRLRLPVIVVEPLRTQYPWASARFHHFIVDGMVDNHAALKDSPVEYYPYVETRDGDAKGMFAAFASKAALVVSDDSPAFFFSKLLAAAAKATEARLEVVDSLGLYPRFATDRVFTTAASFRRHLQKELPTHLQDLPMPNPLRAARLPSFPRRLLQAWRKWPRTSLRALQHRGWLKTLSIDHSVGVCGKGGARAGQRALRRFVGHNLARYAEKRNRVEEACESGLSPFLHFGHISSHEVFAAVTRAVSWSPANLAYVATGSREGWWGAPSSVEAFLDQLVTWRELSHNGATHQADFGAYSSLPGWAQTSLAEHADDPRCPAYDMQTLESAATHDSLWNAAQRQLVREGKIHGYLRMLWGKKILEWSASPRLALKRMIELNNKYALDGRDPNSYSGILWILGKYDRAWGPERSIFGKVRYMTSQSTARKMDVRGYIETYAAEDSEPGTALASA